MKNLPFDKPGRFYRGTITPTPTALTATEVGEGSVVVRCSPARDVFLGGRGTARVRALGENLLECELSPAAFAGSYFRVTVMDAAGRRAWANPIWLD